MENRFGIKDLILLICIILLTVSVWLAMKQYDRQWTILDEIRKQGAEQTRELAGIRRALQEGATVGAPKANTTTASTETSADPFARVKVAQAQSDYAIGDWLVDNFGAAISKATPLLSTDAYASMMQAKVLECLAYRDPDTLEYIPLLARSWQISPDGMKITFQIRQGVTFSDGEPLDADDVVFTFNLIMNPAIDAPRHRAYYQKIESVTKNDQFEVTFNFKEPYFESFQLAATMDVLPEHFYSKFTPEQFNQHPGLLLGSGQYQLKDPEKWRPGSGNELIRNERYWGEPAPFDRLVYREVAEDAAELVMFRNGEIDLFASPPDQYQKLKADPEVTGRTHNFEYESPNGGYAYIAWNQKRGGQATRFADKRVRQAMTMLIDRQRACDEVMLSYATIAAGPFHRLTKQANPDVQPWPYDPDRAKALLREAGFEDRNNDGVIESADGQPFRFKFTYPSGSPVYERVVFLVRDTLARAGVVADPEPVEWSLLTKKLDERDFDAITLRWTGGIETDIFQMFHSSQILDGGDNMMSYSNPELDKLMTDARSTVLEDKRMPIWHRCHEILHEDQPYTFLFTSQSLVFIDKRVHNVKRTKAGINISGRSPLPLEWYVPKPLQKWGQ